MSSEHLQREIDAADAPAELREALRTAREAGPSPERVARAREATLQRFAHELSAGAAAGAGAALGAGSPSTFATAAGAGSSGGAAHVAGTWLATWAGKLALLGGAMVATAGAYFWAAPETAHDAPEHSPQGQVSAPAQTLAEPLEPAPGPATEATERAQAELEAMAKGPEPVAAVEAKPTAKPEPRRPPVRRRHRQRSHEPAPTLADEIALLSRARAELQVRPEQTLRLAEEHADVFPKGRFVQEREVLAVHALLRRGERAQALERGRRFLATYPDSTHARRVTALLEAAEP